MSASREKRTRKELRESEELKNGDTVKKKKAKQKAKKHNPARGKKIRSVVGSIVAIVVVLALALLIFVNSGVLQKNTTALTVGSHKLSPAEFNYYYWDSYYNMQSTYGDYWSYFVDESKKLTQQDYTDGQTWSEYLKQTATDNAKNVYVLYDAAQKAGYELDEETQTELDSVSSGIDSAATSNGFDSADDYIANAYGNGCTKASYLEYARTEKIAEGYSTTIKDGFTYTEDELRSYYNDNAQEYDTVNYRSFAIDGTDNMDAAKETADKMLAALDGTEQSFIDACKEYCTEDQTETYAEDDASLTSYANYSNISTDFSDWLFSADRTDGESEIVTDSSGSGYTVVMFVSRENNEYNTVNFRHILIQVATSGEDGTSTDEDWNACKDSIDAIEQEWEDSDKTEDTFASMATEKSTDTGSKDNGGLYEDVYKGQMVAPITEWLFDDSRKAGDTSVIKTSYGYHLVYFSGTNDTEYWQTLAEDGKRTADYEAWYEDASSSYTTQDGFLGMLFTKKNR